MFVPRLAVSRETVCVKELAGFIAFLRVFTILFVVEADISFRCCGWFWGWAAEICVTLGLSRTKVEPFFESVVHRIDAINLIRFGFGVTDFVD